MSVEVPKATDAASVRRPAPLRVGCILSAKKQRHINFAGLRDNGESDNIDLVVVDLARDLGSQGPFDVLLHKMTDVLVQQRHADTAAKAKIDNMQCYLAKHPETIMVPGSLSAAQLLCSRESTYRKVYEACASGLTESVTPPSSGATGVPRHAKIGVAPYVCVTPGPLQKPEPGNKRSLEPTQDALKKMAKSVSDAQLKYPLICKPVVAHGKASAHLMSIIFDEQGLADVLEPSVLQQYIPHGAVVFKVFVLGDTHGVSRRPSIRDLRGGWTGGPRETVFFDSHDVSKPHSRSDLNEEGAHLRDDVVLDGPMTEELVRRLKDAFGLSLFGVDVVVEAETGDLHVVDVNYFPGYADFPDFHGGLLRLLRRSHLDHERARESRSRAATRSD